MKLILNLILLIVAWILLRLVLGIAFVYTVIKLLVKRDIKGLSNYFYSCALTLDMSGNIIGQHLFNDWWIKPHGYRFGETGVTISKVLAINKKKGTWYKFGAGLGWLLNKIDKGHLEKSKV